MDQFRPQFTKIKDLSDRRRLPRLGKLRLGVKLKSRRTGKEYPCETPYFVCPPEVQKVYGERPMELDIMLPLNDPEAVFPQRYIWYGSAKGAKCMGDGEKAIRLNEETGELEERPCPCEMLGTGCSERAHLLVILPRVNVGGVYQIDIGSYHSIVDVNSAIDYVQALIGRFAMVPLKLRRTPRETHGSGRKEIHYPLQITLDGDINLINALRENTTRVLAATHYALPAPVAENPVMDEGAVVETEDEPPEEQAAPVEDPPPTPEEIREDMKAAGMIPADTKEPEPKPAGPKLSEEPTKEQKDAWAKQLQGYITGVQGFTNMPELNKWFVRIRKESGLPEKYLNELIIQVNEKLLKLKNSK
jgi:hypothetical protein